MRVRADMIERVLQLQRNTSDCQEGLEFKKARQVGSN